MFVLQQILIVIFVNTILLIRVSYCLFLLVKICQNVAFLGQKISQLMKQNVRALRTNWQMANKSYTGSFYTLLTVYDKSHLLDNENVQ